MALVGVLISVNCFRLRTMHIGYDRIDAKFEEKLTYMSIPVWKFRCIISKFIAGRYANTNINR